MVADRNDPQRMQLTKHHALDNDFLVAIAPSRPLGPDDARAWCHRQRGIGADGLLQAVPTHPGGSGWRMTLWNADGGQPEVSGNGLRCLAQALADHLQLDRSTDRALAIETDAGPRPATVHARPATGTGPVDQVTVAMGKAVPGPEPSERWAELGLEVAHQVGVDVGNPHLVGFVGDSAMADGSEPPALHDLGGADGPGGLGTVDIATIGAGIEADRPDGLNVHVARVLDRNRIEIVIWERGVGITQACGSGACAAAWAASRLGLVDDRVEVIMPGGSATVGIDGDELTLTGPAVRVAEVIVDG
jgi:diaminopimelate epimerase